MVPPVGPVRSSRLWPSTNLVSHSTASGRAYSSPEPTVISKDSFGSLFSEGWPAPFWSLHLRPPSVLLAMADCNGQSPLIFIHRSWFDWPASLCHDLFHSSLSSSRSWSSCRSCIIRLFSSQKRQPVDVLEPRTEFLAFLPQIEAFYKYISPTFQGQSQSTWLCQSIRLYMVKWSLRSI